MSCSVEKKLKVVNKDEIKDKIKKIEDELKRKDYSDFPHYIICKLNRPWTEDEEYEVDNVCINTITDYITLDILKNDDLIKIEPSDQLDINEDEYEYRIKLTPKFKKWYMRKKLEIINPEERLKLKCK